MRHIKLYEELSEWTKELFGLRNYYLISYNYPANGNVSYDLTSSTLIGNLIKKELELKGIKFRIVKEAPIGIFLQMDDLNIEPLDIISRFRKMDKIPLAAKETWTININRLKYYNRSNGDYDIFNDTIQKDSLKCSIYKYGTNKMSIYRYNS